MPGHQDTAAQRKSGAVRGVPLERKLPLLVVALFALLFGASLAVAYYEQRHAAIETAGERLASIDRVFGSLIERLSTPGANWRGAPTTAQIDLPYLPDS